MCKFSIKILQKLRFPGEPQNNSVEVFEENKTKMIFKDFLSNLLVLYEKISKCYFSLSNKIYKKDLNEN